LFDVAEPNKDGKCPEGYKSINAGHDAGLRECLKLKEGMQKYAARFEFRRYAPCLFLLMFCSQLVLVFV
jgi:hypothetical protein